eukprot:5906411-Pleurochrysis_carterae.AAC.4
MTVPAHRALARHRYTIATPASDGAAQMFSPPTIPNSEDLRRGRRDGRGWTGEAGGRLAQG